MNHLNEKVLLITQNNGKTVYYFLLSEQDTHMAAVLTKIIVSEIISDYIFTIYPCTGYRINFYGMQ